MRNLREVFQRRDRLAEAYQAVFNTPEGEIVLAHLCKNAFVFEPTFSPLPHEMALNEGSRRVVLSIIKMLGIDLFKLRNMMEDLQNDV